MIWLPTPQLPAWRPSSKLEMGSEAAVTQLDVTAKRKVYENKLILIHPCWPWALEFWLHSDLGFPLERSVKWVKGRGVPTIPSWCPGIRRRPLRLDGRAGPMR